MPKTLLHRGVAESEICENLRKGVLKNILERSVLNREGEALSI
jgi:hypothetical protein